MGAIPKSFWRWLGQQAIGFAEYSLEQRVAPHPPRDAAPATMPAAPEVVAPPPAPPTKILRDYYDEVDAIYHEVLGRPTDSGNELYEAAILLRDGKRDELVADLEKRKKTP